MKPENLSKFPAKAPLQVLDDLAREALIVRIRFKV